MRWFKLCFLSPIILTGGIASAIFFDAPESVSDTLPQELVIEDTSRLAGQFRPLRVNSQQIKIINEFCQIPGVKWAALRGLRGSYYKSVTDCNDAPDDGLKFKGKLLIGCVSQENYFACPVASQSIGIIEISHASADIAELKQLVARLEASYAIKATLPPLMRP